MVKLNSWMVLGWLPLLAFPLISGLNAAQAKSLGSFTATRACAAPRAINGQNPGKVQLTVGKRYEVVGFNSPARKFVWLHIAGAKPERRWVSITCGTLQATPTPTNPDSGSPSRPTPSTLLPFFDQVNNPVSVAFPTEQRVDITPPTPQLTAFDQAVLQSCGAIGSKVPASRFKQLLSDHPQVLSQIQQAVGRELLPGRRTAAEFLDDLTAVWFDREGFEHIFCGELESSQKIGGLHFMGRYLQLQRQGIGGRLPNNSQREEVVPGAVYTLGVVVKQGDRQFTDTLKGYAYEHADSILINATRAFKAQGNAQGACLYPVTDARTNKSFQAVFVKDRQAIVTFYPDATPRGKACRE